MAYSRLPRAVVDQVIGRVTLNQLADNLDWIREALSYEHVVHDGEVTASQSRIGEHSSSSGSTEAEFGMTLKACYAIEWTPPRIAYGADKHIGPVGDESLISREDTPVGAHYAMALRIRGLSVVSAVAMPMSSNTTDAKLVRVEVTAASWDVEYPWRVICTPLTLSGTDWLAPPDGAGFGFSLALWGL